ncbi:hypothetical protein D0S45_17525 [Marinifilum sp. JC120]|nr:hypothetical protein D0S45_17525 [Marinifilum sp. JC120]
MIKATPAVENLIEEISLAIAKGNINEIKMAYFKRKAKNLMNADTTQAYCALGILWGEEENEKLSRSCYQQALETAGPLEHAQVLFNYGISLINLGYYEEGRNNILEAVKTDNTNLLFLSKLIEVLYDYEDNELPKYLTRWEKLHDGEIHPIAEEIEDAEDILEALESIKKEGTVSWEQVKAECNLQ